MKSQSKIAVTTETLNKLCRKYLGQAMASSFEITDGWYNTIFILTLTDDSRAVLKVSPPPTFSCMRYERDILSTEVAVHHRLKSEGLLVPSILVDSPEGDLLGHSWFLMEYLDGVDWGKAGEGATFEQKAETETAIARQLARVNALRGNRFGRWNEDQVASPRWSLSFALMVEDLLADARDVGVLLPWTDEQFRRLLKSEADNLDVVTEPHLVLWDLHPRNVMVKRESFELLGFLDTDRALWGDPLLEFYFRTVAEASQNWLDAYRKASGEANLLDHPSAERRLALYDLYLALVMVIEAVYRGFDEEHKVWAQNYLDRTLAGLWT